ncbi:hypothetical protein K469DRAFT_698020 [Zopfia rhizophila CBS 207.26]|uniref:Uncharacterized protein n=1 Tax=Zopfia rhizophila CBS 207.26 TaxID=1314779 RepID=A0A6A6EJD5_9PEZI|nr:hypothetical protein K469DRAFT_698020 [Zopfia rhizophila CBS 207.26]
MNTGDHPQTFDSCSEESFNYLAYTPPRQTGQQIREQAATAGVRNTDRNSWHIGRFRYGEAMPLPPVRQTIADKSSTDYQSHPQTASHDEECHRSFLLVDEPRRQSQETDLQHHDSGINIDFEPNEHDGRPLNRHIKEGESQSARYSGLAEYQKERRHNQLHPSAADAPPVRGFAGGRIKPQNFRAIPSQSSVNSIAIAELLFSTDSELITSLIKRGRYTQEARLRRYHQTPHQHPRVGNRLDFERRSPTGGPAIPEPLLEPLTPWALTPPTPILEPPVAVPAVQDLGGFVSVTPKSTNLFSRIRLHACIGKVKSPLRIIVSMSYMATLRISAFKLGS